MGLDLTLYATKHEIDKDIELAYGRKTWNIFDALTFGNCPINEEESEYNLDIVNWNSFVENIGSIKEEILAAIKGYTELDKYGKTSKHKRKCIKKYEKWYEDSFYQTPILGLDWDAYFLLKWYRADKDVIKYLSKGYDIILYASY